MTDNERHFDPHTGLPEVSPDDIKAFKDQPHPFEEQFQRLLKENPALAHELATRHAAGESGMRTKRAFAEGALFVYFILGARLEANSLQEIFDLPTSGGVGDEDQQPSA